MEFPSPCRPSPASVMDTKRREPDGGVRLASSTAQELASDALILHCEGQRLLPGSLPKLSLRVVIVPNARSRLAAVQQSSCFQIDITDCFERT